MAPCPRCGDRMLPLAPGEWGCALCGHQEVAFQHSAPVAFRADPPRKARRAPRGSRQGGLAIALAVLLIAGGIATAGYVLMTQPEATSLLGFSPVARSNDRGPTDHEAPVAVDGVFHREFRWEFGDREYTWTMNITAASYDYFRSLDRPVRRYQEHGVWRVQPAYDLYVSNVDDDPFIDALARSLLEQAQKEGFSDSDSLSFALSFVQSLPYTQDEVTTAYDEWPRFPVETLVDGGGDCEDTAVLFASLALAMGFGAIMVSPPGHMAVGVQASESFPGTKYAYDGLLYAYSETTGDGYGFGEVPDEYDGDEVVVYDLTAKPLFSLDAQFGEVDRSGRQEVRLRATQTGSAPAHGVRLVATVGTSTTQYHEAHCDFGDVQPGAVVECPLLLDLNRVPKGQCVRIRTVVQDQDYIFDEADSNMWDPHSRRDCA